jgi:hypothetical protein
VAKGVTEKLTPLAEVPMGVPPLETVYHLIVFPAEVAFSCDDEPHVNDAGVAETDVGVVGRVTVTTTAARVGLLHVPLVASA